VPWFVLSALVIAEPLYQVGRDYGLDACVKRAKARLPVEQAIQITPLRQLLPVKSFPWSSGLRAGIFRFPILRADMLSAILGKMEPVAVLE